MRCSTSGSTTLKPPRRTWLRMAAGEGVEPSLPGSEPGVLPLDDPASLRYKAQTCRQAHNPAAQARRRYLVRGPGQGSAREHRPALHRHPPLTADWVDQGGQPMGLLPSGVRADGATHEPRDVRPCSHGRPRGGWSLDKRASFNPLALQDSGPLTVRRQGPADEGQSPSTSITVVGGGKVT